MDEDKRSETLNDGYKTAIFSGRFEPYHIGHLLTIAKLLIRFNKVVVVILDYPEREICSAKESQRIIESIFNQVLSQATRSKVDVVINTIHFGKITYAEYDLFLRNLGACNNHTIYLSGNPEVKENMKKQGIPHEFIERSLDNIYEGTKIRKYLESNG